MRLTTRLMGAELEYLASSDDGDFKYVDEYYSGMREVNSILLPATDIKVALTTLKHVLVSMQSKIKNTIGTHGWHNSYGYAYNGVHLHLSGSINTSILKINILKLIGKYGMSPRTVTSWHIFDRPTNFNFKRKRKHCPVYNTPRGTSEIRALDIEYFMDDTIIEDLARAIDGAYNGKIVDGDTTWADTLMHIPLEDYRASCKLLDTNMHKDWVKLDEGIYRHKYTTYAVDFTTFEEWRRENNNNGNEEVSTDDFFDGNDEGNDEPARVGIARPSRPIRNPEFRPTFDFATITRMSNTEGASNDR